MKKLCGWERVKEIVTTWSFLYNSISVNHNMKNHLKLNNKFKTKVQLLYHKEYLVYITDTNLKNKIYSQNFIHGRNSGTSASPHKVATLKRVMGMSTSGTLSAFYRCSAGIFSPFLVERYHHVNIQS